MRLTWLGSKFTSGVVPQKVAPSGSPQGRMRQKSSLRAFSDPKEFPSWEGRARWAPDAGRKGTFSEQQRLGAGWVRVHQGVAGQGQD